mmetsp:Transcript_10528/g.36730  ORF Transcript_10528/g.36730 Transcript_10528/m.36730 type:complete len:1865 (-) Transcript_10528:131-5725(-)
MASLVPHADALAKAPPKEVMRLVARIRGGLKGDVVGAGGAGGAGEDKLTMSDDDLGELARSVTHAVKLQLRNSGEDAASGRLDTGAAKACLDLLIDVLRQGGASASVVVADALPEVVGCVAADAVRPAAVDLMIEHIRVSRGSRPVALALVGRGLTHEVASVRAHAAAVVPLVLISMESRRSPPPDFRRIIEGLAGCLRDPETSVVEAALRALGRVQAACGDRDFDKHTKKLSYAHQQYVSENIDTIRHYASQRAAGRRGARGLRKALSGSDDTHDSDDSPTAGGPAAMSPRVASSVPHSPVGSPGIGASARGIAGEPAFGPVKGAAVGSPLAKHGSAGNVRAAERVPRQVEFGFVPGHVVDELAGGVRLGGETPAGGTEALEMRSTAAAELLAAAKRACATDPATFSTSLGPLLRFISTVVGDAVYKVSNAGLQVLEIVAECCGGSMRPHLDLVLPTLVGKLGDNKVVIREAAMKALSRLMHVVGSTSVLPTLLSCASDRKWHVREATLSMITLALLTNSRLRPFHYDVVTLVRTLAPLLSDPKLEVRHTADHMFAVLQNVEGASADILAMLGTLGFAPTSEPMQRLASRLRDGALPSVNADGLVSFPSTAGGGGHESVPTVTPASAVGQGHFSFASPDVATPDSGSADSGGSESPRAGGGHRRQPSAGRSSSQQRRIPFEIPRARAGSGSRRVRDTPTPTEEHMPPNPFASGRSFAEDVPGEPHGRRDSTRSHVTNMGSVRSAHIQHYDTVPDTVEKSHIRPVEGSVGPSPVAAAASERERAPTSPTAEKTNMSVHVPEDAHRDMAAYTAALELDPDSPDRRSGAPSSRDAEIGAFDNVVRDRSRPVRAGAAGGGPSSAGEARVHMPAAPSPVTTGRRFEYGRPYGEPHPEATKLHGNGSNGSNGDKVALWLPDGGSGSSHGSGTDAGAGAGSASSVGAAARAGAPGRAGSSSESVADGSFGSRGPIQGRRSSAGRARARTDLEVSSSAKGFDMSISAPNSLGAALQDAAATNGGYGGTPTEGMGIAHSGRSRARTDFGPDAPTGYEGVTAEMGMASPASVREESPRARMGRRALQVQRSQSAHPPSPDKLGSGDPSEMKTRLALLKGRNRGAAAGRRAASASSRVEGVSGASSARDDRERGSRPPRTSVSGAMTPDPKSSSHWRERDNGDGGSSSGFASPDPDDRPIRPMRSAFAEEDEEPRGGLTVETGEDRPIRPMGGVSSPDIYAAAAASEDAYVPSAIAAHSSRSNTPRVSRATLAARERREKARTSAVSPVHDPRHASEADVSALRTSTAGAGRSPIARRVTESAASGRVSPARPRLISDDGPRTPSTGLPSSKGAEIQYLDSSEIEPLGRDVDREARRIVSKMKQAGWEEQFQALDTLRALSIHHAEKVVPNIHPIILASLPLVGNLRSAVSRNCLLAYADLFTGLGAAMDPELDTMVPELLSRSVDSLRILVSCAEAALDRMVENCTTLRCITSLLNSLDHKNSAVRTRVGEYLARCVERLGSRIIGTREADRVVQAGVKLTGEGREEARRAGKTVVYRLADIGMLDERFIRTMPEKTATKLRSLIEKRPKDFAPSSFAVGGAAGGAGGSASRAASRGAIGSRGVATSARGRGRPRRLQSNQSTGGFGGEPVATPQSEELADLLSQLDTSDWRERQGGLMKLVEFCESHRRVAVARAPLIADKVSQCLSDGNHKVIAVAADSLIKILPVLKDSLEGSIPQLMQPLATNVTASQRAVADTSRRALDELVRTVDCRSLVLPIVALVSHGNSKVKVVMTDKLAELVPDVYYKKVSLIEKHVLPALFGQLGESRKDMRTAIERALEVVARCVGGPAVMEAAATIPAAQQDRLRSILRM